MAGCSTCIVYCRIKKINLLNVLDFMAPYVILGQAIGRWGNFVNVEAYGTQTNLLWRMGIIESAKYIEVHPTFLYESLGNFIIFIILMFKRKKKNFEGEIVLIYAMLYSFIRMFIEGLRTDSLMLGALRVSQVLSFSIFVVSSVILLKKVVIQKSLEKK